MAISTGGEYKHFEEEERVDTHSRLHLFIVQVDEAGGKNNDSLHLSCEVLGGATEVNGKWIENPYTGQIIGIWARHEFQTTLYNIAIALGIKTKDEIMAMVDAGRMVELDFTGCVEQQFLCEWKYSKKSGGFFPQNFYALDDKKASTWHRNWKLAGQTPPPNLLPLENASGRSSAPAASGGAAAAGDVADMF